MDAVSKSVEDARKEGDHERSDRLEEKKEANLGMKYPMHSVQKQLNLINKQIKLVQIDRNMTPDAKRKELDELQADKNELTKTVMDDARENSAR